MLPRPIVSWLRRRSLIRGIVLPLAALFASLRLIGYPQIHSSRWLALPVLLAGLGTWETARCLRRKWSLYHAGILILLYSDLMILAMVLFLWWYL